MRTTWLAGRGGLGAMTFSRWALPRTPGVCIRRRLVPRPATHLDPNLTIFDAAKVLGLEQSGRKHYPKLNTFSYSPPKISTSRQGGILTLVGRS